MESILSKNLCIVHGTITIMRVTLGQIALAWQDSKPTFFEKPGLLDFDSPDFSFVKFTDAKEQLIQPGVKKIVLVHTGQVGVTYDQGWAPCHRCCGTHIAPLSLNPTTFYSFGYIELRGKVGEAIGRNEFWFLLLQQISWYEAGERCSKGLGSWLFNVDFSPKVDVFHCLLPRAMVGYMVTSC